uniref:Clathrin light chain n=1 Tax=Plectus sambesii TaxID=2011161 RepID=A0A914VVR7_9BILA
MADPVADFLAREQDELAGLDDDSVPTSGADTPSVGGGVDEAPMQMPAAVDDFGDMGNAGDFGHGGGLADAGDSGVDLSNLVDQTPPVANPTPPSFSNVPRIEPEKIRKWRQDQKQRLEQKDEAEEKKMQEWRGQAKKELDDWYKSRRDQLEKSKKNNRASEQDFIAERDTSEPGAEWERIT